MSRFAAGLAEIVLIVEDVRRSARFYRDVVALEPDGEANDAWAWFFAGEPGKPHRIALHRGTLLFEEHSPHPPGRRFGQVHLALLVPRDRLDGAVQHVRSHGVEVYGPARFDWMDATGHYFYDPDGNLLEFWSPEPAGTALLRAHVERFNAGVRSGDFSAMLAHFADDAQMVFEGVPVGPFRGRDAIGEAYRTQPPDDQLVVLDVLEDTGARVVAAYAWMREPTRRAGRMILEADGGTIARLTVTFEPAGG